MDEALTGTSRAALVTGSSRGIGAAIAIALAQAKHDVCINYASEASAAAADELAVYLCATHGIKAFALRADVSDFAQATALVSQAHDAFGRLDVLVNNAGITRDGLLARMKEEDFDAVISTNLKGAFNCCRAATPLMMKQRFGRIINMSSIVGVAGNAGQANYAASKAGLIGLSKALAREVAPRNITVNAVAPGFIETDMTAALSEAQQEGVLARIASKRFGTPQEVAALVCFLASDQAGYLTGQVIGIDGGMSL
ncbi:MAG: 3-oxoacyl-[acyl-carrier-protein] reductase [Raoultibacter sp.]